MVTLFMDDEICLQVVFPYGHCLQPPHMQIAVARLPWVDFDDPTTPEGLNFGRQMS